MLSEQVPAPAVLGDHTDPAQFVHGGNDESPFGAGGADAVAGPDLSAAGTDIHAALTDQYQSLIEGHAAAISRHLIMFVNPDQPSALPIRHFDRRPGA
jgi:hypothetical protein